MEQETLDILIWPILQLTPIPFSKQNSKDSINKMAKQLEHVFLL